jgi:hypothetical protein
MCTRWIVAGAIVVTVLCLLLLSFALAVML